MGEAKRKKESAQSLSAIPDDVLNRVSAAIRKVASAASSQFGGDCYFHAAAAQQLLKEQGFETSLVIGEAAWRVGDGDGDVISHVLSNQTILMPGAFPYHTWLRYGYQVLDFTTYQLEEKAAQLDALDGQHTTVDWCPDYLNISQKETSSYEDTAQGLQGIFYYREMPSLKMELDKLARPIEEEDMISLRIVYNNPNMHVVGPRHLSR